MWKTNFLLLLIILFSQPFSSAVFSQQLKRVGIRLGLNVSDMSGPSEFPNLAHTTKSSVGLFSRFSINELLSIQPELLFAMKGADYITNMSNRNASIDISYLELPLLVNIQVKPTHNISPNLFWGPYFSINIDDNLTFVGEPGFDTDFVDSFDYGLTFGAGIEFKMGLGNLSFDGRYSYGIDNVRIFGFKNRVLSLNVGYSFFNR
ncbi:PorT family protein [candidate division KSB1 bacterium]|nr:PorT family protein [candidate division KSB1 bacterium]NIR69780.1 PorT family protein [candidate division KSB1 bacterium]NIS22963.1 PorT family protein [candidate division KSB1 bacterium]NIT69820.1 PorT family protein [candidate division KSB1 bacterium]NIU23494.1 PorT family protein [candidate division KSB1 bacterium]